MIPAHVQSPCRPEQCEPFYDTREDHSRRWVVMSSDPCLSLKARHRLIVNVTSRCIIAMTRCRLFTIRLCTSSITHHTQRTLCLDIPKRAIGVEPLLKLQAINSDFHTEFCTCTIAGGWCLCL